MQNKEKVFCKNCRKCLGLNLSGSSYLCLDCFNEIMSINYYGETRYVKCSDKNMNCDCPEYEEKVSWFKNIFKKIFYKKDKKDFKQN
jgi:hypothetical protein